MKYIRKLHHPHFAINFHAHLFLSHRPHFVIIIRLMSHIFLMKLNIRLSHHFPHHYLPVTVTLTHNFLFCHHTCSYSVNLSHELLLCHVKCLQLCHLTCHRAARLVAAAIVKAFYLKRSWGWHWLAGISWLRRPPGRPIWLKAHYLYYPHQLAHKILNRNRH